MRADAGIRSSRAQIGGPVRGSAVEISNCLQRCLDFEREDEISSKCCHPSLPLQSLHPEVLPAGHLLICSARSFPDWAACLGTDFEGYGGQGAGRGPGVHAHPVCRSELCDFQQSCFLRSVSSL